MGKAWGKCDTAANPWMKGFCCKTCFDCAAGCGDTRHRASRQSNSGGSIRIDRLELKANYATGAGEFWIDRLAFV